MLKKIKGRLGITLIIIVVTQFILLLNLKFTAWPEMILWPYLNLHGWQLYRDIAVAHSPLLLFKLDFFYGIFGVGIWQLKIFTWILIIAFDAVVYFIASRLMNRKVALFAIVVFAVWQIFYDGNGLWFDLFMGLIAFASFYFVEKEKWLLAGVFWALAVWSKQTAVWFIVPIGLVIINDKWQTVRTRIVSFAVGSIVVTVLFTLSLFLLGILPDFYHWAIKFGVVELPRAQGQIRLPDVKNLSIAAFPFLIFIPWLFLQRKNRSSFILWALAGAAGAYPRFEYFHFQPAVPYLAIASAMLFSGPWHKKDLVKVFVPIYVIGCLYLLSGFFVRNYGEGTRFYEKDVQGIVKYIKSNTHPGDKIFVMNWWDNTYALTGTIPATHPWVPQLSWYQDLPGIQDKEVADLASQKPKMVVLSNYSSAGLGASVPDKVYNFVTSNYQLKEKVEGVEILIPKN